MVSHEFEVKLLKRIDLNGGATSSEAIYNFLADSKTLFDIMAEEDPQYAQVELLQNAGIIPVNHGGRN